jgi:hypothetical protein
MDVCWCTVPEKRAVFLLRKMVLPHEQRIFVVKHYFCNKSYALCQESFQETLPNDAVLNKTTIYSIITKFKETGYVSSKT